MIIVSTNHEELLGGVVVVEYFSFVHTHIAMSGVLISGIRQRLSIIFWSLHYIVIVY